MEKQVTERKKMFDKCFFCELFFSSQNISVGNQVEAGSKRMPLMHQKCSFEVRRYSRKPPTQQYVKNMAKRRFLTIANPTLEIVLGGSTAGGRCKCNAGQPHDRIKHAKNWLGNVPYGMSPGTTNSEELKIENFC